MPLSHSDLTTRGWLKANITASADAVVTGAIRIMAVSLTSAAANSAVLILFNALTQTGTDRINQATLTGSTTTVLCLGPNGTRFSTGLSATLTGANTFCEVYYLVE